MSVANSAQEVFYEIDKDKDGRLNLEDLTQLVNTRIKAEQDQKLSLYEFEQVIIAILFFVIVHALR